MNKSCYLLGLVVLLSSCLKDELPVPVRESGSVQVGQACIGANYATQCWYDLGTNTVVSTNSKSAWDLAFECGTNGWQARLNSAKFMRAVAIVGGSITEPVDTSGFAMQWRIDGSNGERDSLALGDWRAVDRIYAIDLGYNDLGLPQGVRQLRINSVNETTYAFEITDMNGANVRSYTVAKDPTRAYVHFSLSSGSQTTIAPPKGSYDLVFTQYSFQFNEPLIAYLVTGAVNAHSGLRVASITNPDFAAVALSDTLQHPFSADEDAIGYAWKTYDFDLAVYTVSSDHVFIVQDSQGLFFKLRFIDFYNDQGERGCPKFEVVAF